MNSEFRKQIYSNLNLKDTDELLSIWKTNDRVEWSDTAFEIIEEILKNRLGEIPEQDQPIFEHIKEEDFDDIDADGLKTWESKLIDNENQPDFYDTLEVLSLNKTINQVAKAVIVVNVLVGLWSLPVVKMLIETGQFVQLSDMATYIPSMFITLLSVGLQIAITYFSLKALAHILRILMEMEFNSRKTK